MLSGQQQIASAACCGIAMTDPSHGLGGAGDFQVPSLAQAVAGAVAQRLLQPQGVQPLEEVQPQQEVQPPQEVQQPAAQAEPKEPAENFGLTESQKEWLSASMEKYSRQEWDEWLSSLPQAEHDWWLKCFHANRSFFQGPFKGDGWSWDDSTPGGWSWDDSKQAEAPMAPTQPKAPAAPVGTWGKDAPPASSQDAFEWWGINRPPPAPKPNLKRKVPSNSASSGERSEKLQSGWQPRTIALIAAIQNHDTSRVNYLIKKFTEDPDLASRLQRHRQHVANHGWDPQYDY